MRTLLAKRFVAKIVLTLCLLSMLFPSVGSAQLPYSTGLIDRQNGEVTNIQPVYVPKQIIDSNRVDRPFSSPSDLFIAENGHVYIADTGNNRIVELDGNGEFIRSIGDEEGPGKLNAPEGVFTDAKGTVYVANTEGRSIVKYDREGRFIEAFEKPKSDLLFDTYHFLPTKLVVDRRGVMYIVVKNTYQGLFRMNAKGEFTGFFGANKASMSLMNRLQRMILPRDQVERLAPIRPNAIQNISLTDDGFLLVTSSGTVSDGQIRKLNAGGQDAFGNRPFDPYLIDTVMDAEGFMYAYSTRFGDLQIYDPTGFQFLGFGTADAAARQQGVTAFPTSLDISGNQDIWVLDSAQNLVQVFERTSFGDTLLKANELYFQGRYAEADSYWEEVRRQNGMIDFALTGLGQQAMNEGKYAEAVAYFKEARNAAGYSDAFWFVRYDWLKTHFVTLLAVLIAVFWAVSFLYRRRKQIFGKVNWPPWLRRYGMELQGALYVMFHPYEGYYRIKERKVSYGVIALILGAAVAVNLYAIFGSSLLAYPYDIAKVNLALSVGLLIVPWATWIIANYLVSTVKGGEGRFREVLQASAFALMPYILLTLAATLVSNILVYEEWVIYSLIRQIMWVWIIVLLFVMTQVTHNFEFMETAKNIAITLFTVAVIWVFGAIMIGLSGNLLAFIQQIYREVTFVA